MAISKSDNNMEVAQESQEINDEMCDKDVVTPVVKDLLYYLYTPTKIAKGNAETKTDEKDTQEIKSSSHETDDKADANQLGTITALPLPVAAMKTLLGVIRTTKANTMMGLQDELRQATNQMIDFFTSYDPNNRFHSAQHAYPLLGNRSYISLQSGCELFMKYVTRTFLEFPNFQDCISEVLERAEQFAQLSEKARSRIASVGQPFIRDGAVVLSHGYSRVVMDLLLYAANNWNTQFTLYLLEGRPDAGGVAMAKAMYEKAGIPTTVVLDSAMGYVMERHVDLVIVGAEGVVENGGIVNKMGTYAMGICAKELNKPFYVAVESYKFARLFPLNQSELPDMNKAVSLKSGRKILGGGNELDFVNTTESSFVMEKSKEKQNDKSNTKEQICSIPGLMDLPSQVNVENPPCDYTPAKYITLLFTDLGVFTPSAVSDELIRLYQ